MSGCLLIHTIDYGSDSLSCRELGQYVEETLSISFHLETPWIQVWLTLQERFLCLAYGPT